MPAVLRYVRDRVRDAKTNQRVRLGVNVNVAATSYEVFNLASEHGNYARAFRRNEGIQFAFTSRGSPPYEHEIQVSNTENAQDARFCLEPSGRVRLSYSRGSNVYERTSDDDGLTWSGETITSIVAAFSDISCDRWSTLLRTTLAAGVISATRQYAGDAAISASFSLQLAGGFPLLVEADSYRIVASTYERGKWWLHVRPALFGATALYWSADDGETWTIEGGAVTGIAAGLHPGLAIGPDDTMWAWAVLGAGTVSVTRRYAGDTAWSAPFLLKDSAAANVIVRDNALSLAPSWEEPGRLMLVYVKSADTQVTDAWSADDSATETPFV